MRSILVALSLLTVAAAAHAAGQPKVLVLAASSSSGPDVQSKLMATGAFSAVDVMEIDGTTPTLAQLQAYDAVILYTYLAPADPVAMGDVLASYLESGGGVVLFDWETLESPTYQLDGKYVSTYSLMNLQDENSVPTNPFKLGTINEQGSPLLAGVTNVACTTNGSCHHLSSTPKQGAIVVAQWDDGTPAVLRGNVNGHVVVELNFFGPSDDTSIGEWDHTTDGAILMKNALLYSMLGGVRADKGSIAFPDTNVGDTSTVQTVTYTNTGMQAATITQVALSGTNAGDFTITPKATLPQTVAPNGTFQVDVVFSPTTKGAKSALLTATVQGQMNSPTTALSGNAIGGPIAILPNPVRMGGALLNATLTKTVTISNDTTANLTLTSVSVTLDGTSFTFTPNFTLPVTLSPAQGVTGTVTFKSGTAGNHVGQITLLANGQNPQNVALYASTGDPAITVNNSSLVFGNQHVGASAPPTAVSITNSGFSDLHLTAATVGGANAGDFSLGGVTLPATIAPGVTLPYTVGFKPTATGSRTATISLTSDDPMNGTVSYTVAGTGVAFSESLAPTSLDFGMVKGGTASTAQNVTVTNSSGALLNVTSIQITGAGAAFFGAGVNGPTTVAANGTLMIPVTFKPTAAGAQSATLVVGTDDPNLPTMSCALTGTGVTGKIVVTPASIDFGKIAAGTTAPDQTVTITNMGNADLVVSGVSMATGAVFNITMDPTPVTIAPNATATVKVNYSPTNAGADSDTLQIASDDPMTPTASVALTGTAVAPGLDVAPLTVDFGNVPVNVASMPQTITMTNTGQADLTINTLSIGGPDAGAFSVSMGGPLTIKVGQQVTVDVKFQPKTVAAASATLSIFPGSTSVPQVDVQLTGNGTSDALSISPTTFNFGLINTGTPSTPQTFTIKNTGTQTLLLAPITSTNPTVFVVDASMTELKLVPGTSTTFAVTFKPASDGPTTAQVAILLQGATKPAAIITVQGEGLKVVPKDGGCSLAGSAPTGGAAGLALVLGLLALVLRRRRR